LSLAPGFGLFERTNGRLLSNRLAEIGSCKQKPDDKEANGTPKPRLRAMQDDQRSKYPAYSANLKGTLKESRECHASSTVAPFRSPTYQGALVIPIDRWSNITRQGIEFAARLSSEVIALHVEPTEHSELLEMGWEHYFEQPSARQARSHPSSMPCLHLTDSSSSPSFNSFSTFEKTSRSEHHRGHTRACGR